MSDTHTGDQRTAELMSNASPLGTGASAILDGYMTETELAAQLDRSPHTLARWRALDEGPPVTRIG